MARRRRRQIRPRPQQPRHVLLTEGTVTEVAYFTGLNHVTTGCRLIVPKRLCGKSPEKLLTAAVHYRRDKRRDGDWTANDRIWCVVDQDDWPDLDATRRRAIAKDVGLLVTAPCFEFWLLLHFEDCRRHLNKDELRRRLRTYLPGYRKALNFDLVRDSIAIAARRARQLQDDGERPPYLPSSDVCLLIEALQLR